MRKLSILFTLITLVSFIDISFADCADSSSPYKCKKMKIIDDDGNERIDLNCTLPNMDTFPITAEDVFESDGKTLKKYFETNNDVCDVLGWFNEAVPFRYLSRFYPSET